jgi:hypothetical protein
MPIIQRLDAIENARRQAAADHFSKNYPNLDQAEVRRLADLLAATPTRLIAETALACLPVEQTDAILSRFEVGA